MFEKLQKKLLKRREEGSYRELKLNEDLVDFCSNDYLGVSKLLRVKNDGAVGSTGSRLLQGNYTEIEDLEKELASFHQTETGLIYSTGYSANVGLFSALLQKGDVVLYDEYIHASVKDGVRLSFAQGYAFKHNDLSDFEKRIRKVKAHLKGELYVAVESVYSMDGDCSPLQKLVKLSEEHGFVLIVDEAHAVGVFGDSGEGLVQDLGLESKVPIRVVTFGKAVGCHGAIVLCPTLIKEFLVNFSRSFIYSTALPPSSIKVISESYSFLKNTGKTSLLRHNIKYFKEGADLRRLIGLIPSKSAVQCFVIPGNVEVKKSSDFIRDHGFDVRAILSPTVPKGSERLRVCIHAFNTEKEIDDLLDLFVKKIII